MRDSHSTRASQTDASSAKLENEEGRPGPSCTLSRVVSNTKERKRMQCDKLIARMYSKVNTAEMTSHLFLYFCVYHISFHWLVLKSYPIRLSFIYSSYSIS